MFGIDKENRTLMLSYWGLAAICLWNLNGVTALAFGMTQILSVFILALGLFVFVRAKEPWITSLGRPGVWFVVAIAVYLGFGSVLNFEPRLIVSHVNSIFVVLAGAVGARHLAPRIGMQLFATYTAVFASVGALTVYLSPFLRPLYRNLESTEILINAGRWMGFFANPNETGMAGVYALACSLALFSILKPTSRIRRLLPFLIGLLAIGVFLTFSRGAMIGFAAISILYTLIAVKLTGQSIKLMIAAVLLVIGAFYFFTQGYKAFAWTPEQFKRIKSVERIITGQKTTRFDVGSRASGAQAGLKYWSKSPVFGHGLGKLRKMPAIYTRGLGCHNTHVMFLGEVGILGFLFYMGFWGSLLYSSHTQASPTVRQLCLMLSVTMLLNGMVGHTLLDNRNSNFLLGLALGLASLSPELLFAADDVEPDDHPYSDPVLADA